MEHLTDDQLEGILSEQAGTPDHVAHCTMCRGMLAEARAIRARLRVAFETVHASHEFRERVREILHRHLPVEQMVAPAALGRQMSLLRRLWPAMAAAAVLMLAVVTVFYLLETPRAAAAQMELVTIHEHNLTPHGEFHTNADPEQLAEYLKNKLGFVPAMPSLGRGMALRGCCVTHFRNKPVGSYVVQTPQGSISVIVFTDKPESLGMQNTLHLAGRTYRAGTFAKCKMVVTRLNQYTYAAVGMVSHESLADLLSRLVPTNNG